MKKIVLTFGVISGLISSALMVITLVIVNQRGFEYGELIGYTMMVLSFLMVFFGIRSYRENVGRGYITFKRGLGVGLLIMLVSIVFYIATWEVVYHKFMPDFGEKYSAYAVEKIRKAGGDQAAIDAKIKEMQAFKALYDNPLINVAFTFLEPLPVGLLMSFLSAAILRKKRKEEEVEGQTQTQAAGLPNGA